MGGRGLVAVKLWLVKSGRGWWRQNYGWSRVVVDAHTV